MPKNEVKFRPATMAEVEGRDIDLYMDGDRVWVMMIHRSETIGEGEPKLDYIMLTNMKKVQVEDLQVIDNNNNEPISENTIMAQNVKAADLIGKTIVVGDNQATIEIKSVDGDKLSAGFTKDGKTTPMSFPVSQLQGMTEKGLWKVMSDVGSMKSEEKLQSSAVSPQTSEVTTEADVQEVQDIIPVVTPKAKSDGGSKTTDVPQTIPADAPTRSLSDIKPQTSNQPAAIVKPMETKPKAAPKPKAKTQTSDIKHQTSYVYSTYKTSKGKTGAKITGLSETDAVYQQAASIHASGSYTKDKDGNKQFYLVFGPRYAKAAKQVCEALNAGKPIEDAIAIIDKATEERAVKKEEGRRKREEYKAQTSAVSPQTSTEKCYTQSELAEWLRKLNAGDPEAAKFFNDLAKAA